MALHVFCSEFGHIYLETKDTSSLYMRQTNNQFGLAVTPGPLLPRGLYPSITLLRCRFRRVSYT